MAKMTAVPNRHYTREFKVEALRLAESVGGDEAVSSGSHGSIATWLAFALVDKMSRSRLHAVR